MPSTLLSAPCKWFLTQNIPCTVSILILISFLQELKCRKMRWSARSYTVRGVEGRSVGLWLWSLCDLLGCQKPLPVSHVFPAAKGKRPDIGAFYDLTPANCLTLCPPLPGHTGESVPQGSPRSARARPALSPLPTPPAGPASASSPSTANSGCLKPQKFPGLSGLLDLCLPLNFYWLYYSLGICFLAALVFFHIMIQYFMHRRLSTQLEFSLLEVRHVCFICLCIYVTRDNGYENRNWSGWLYHFLTVWPWTNYLISQRCCLSICNLWLKQQ